jgi:hypothetical protein
MLAGVFKRGNLEQAQKGGLTNAGLFEFFADDCVVTDAYDEEFDVAPRRQRATWP